MTRLISSYADALFEWHDENLTVTYVSTLGRFDDCSNGGINIVVIDGDLEAHFLEQVDRMDLPAIVLRVPHLRAAAAYSADGHFMNFGMEESFLDRIQFLGLYNSNNHFHSANSSRLYRLFRVGFDHVNAQVRSSQFFMFAEPYANGQFERSINQRAGH